MDATYAYDANGNMTGGAGRTIAWDAENRPITIALNGITTTFAYDADGKRVKKAETNGSLITTTVYAGSHYEFQTVSPSSDVPWWNPRWASRTVLTATNQVTSVLAAGYALKLSLSGSAASNVFTQSITNGNDLRVLYWDGKAYKELDRDLTVFTSSSIELWVNSQADIAASGQDNQYYLYYANPTANAPLADKRNIYLYFADFLGTPPGWTSVAGTWGTATTTGPDGAVTYAYHESDAASNARAYLSDSVLAISDFVYEVKVKVATSPTGFRGPCILWRYVDGSNFYQVFLSSDTVSSGIGKIVGGAHTYLSSTGGFGYAANTWYTITVSMVGSSQSVAVNGTTKWTATDSSVAGNKIGLKAYNIDAYFDDVKVRKLVATEPTVAMGNEEGRPAANVAKYYYAGGKRIAMRSSGTLSYLFADHLGSTSVVSSTASSQVNSTTYYAFGSTRSGSVPTDYKFTGQALDAMGNLYYYGARYYEQGIGRFISPDTIVPNYENPQSLNRYSYVRNQPLKFTDPTGQAEACDENWQNCEDEPLIDEQSEAEVFDVVAYWYFEEGTSTNLLFDESDFLTRQLMNDEGVDEKRELFYEGLAQGETSLDEGYSFGLGEYFRETAQFFAGMDSSGSMLGSYNVQITANDDGTASFQVDNTLSLESGTRTYFNAISTRLGLPVSQHSIEGLVTGQQKFEFPQDILFESILSSKKRSEPGPGRNLSVRFVWTEPLRVDNSRR